jgi:hypothetical protein
MFLPHNPLFISNMLVLTGKKTGINVERFHSQGKNPDTCSVAFMA